MNVWRYDPDAVKVPEPYTADDWQDAFGARSGLVLRHGKVGIYLNGGGSAVPPLYPIPAT